MLYEDKESAIEADSSLTVPTAALLLGSNKHLLVRMLKVTQKTIIVYFFHKKFGRNMQVDHIFYTLLSFMFKTQNGNPALPFSENILVNVHLQCVSSHKKKILKMN